MKRRKRLRMRLRSGLPPRPRTRQRRLQLLQARRPQLKLARKAKLDPCSSSTTQALTAAPARGHWDGDKKTTEKAAAKPVAGTKKQASKAIAKVTKASGVKGGKKPVLEFDYVAPNGEKRTWAVQWPKAAAKKTAENAGKVAKKQTSSATSGVSTQRKGPVLEFDYVNADGVPQTWTFGWPRWF